MPKSNHKIESLEMWIAWNFLSTERGWDITKIAYELEVNEQRLREWVNNRSAAMNRLVKTNPEKVKKITATLKKQFPEEKPEKDPLPKINLNKVVELMGEQYRLFEIADKLKVDFDLFKQWYHLNRHDIVAAIQRQPRIEPAPDIF